MKSNIGTLDKSIRIILVFTALAIYSIKVLENKSNYIFLIIAAILGLSVLLNYCLLYQIWHFSTKETKEIE